MLTAKRLVMKMIARASTQIQKPLEEVFEGIVSPEKMTNYFISEDSGRMETGATLQWNTEGWANFLAA